MADETYDKIDNFVRFGARLRPAMVEALDKEAEEIGISRMALIQVILHEHLKKEALASEAITSSELTYSDLSESGQAVVRATRGAGFGPGR